MAENVYKTKDEEAIKPTEGRWREKQLVCSALEILVSHHRFLPATGSERTKTVYNWSRLKSSGTIFPPIILQFATKVNSKVGIEKHNRGQHHFHTYRLSPFSRRIYAHTHTSHIHTHAHDKPRLSVVCVCHTDTSVTCSVYPASGQEVQSRYLRCCLTSDRILLTLSQAFISLLLLSPLIDEQRDSPSPSPSPVYGGPLRERE